MLPMPFLVQVCFTVILPLRRMREAPHCLLPAQSPAYGVGNFILDSKDIRQTAIVAFRPNVVSCFCVDKLGCRSYPIATAAHTAFEYVADAKLACDPSDIDCSTAIGEAGVPGDDEQGPISARCQNNLIRKSI